MEVKTARGKLFALLMLILAFPLLQHVFSFYESGKVHGAVLPVGDSSFSWAKWWDGSYQKQKNLYLNDNAGCRADLVRINNQLDFWLYKKLHAASVVIGKDDYLYERDYINEYIGFDYVGDDLVRDKVIKLKKIQDTLERLGKTFVFMYAPSKAYYFPNTFPAEYDPKEAGKHPTNYAAYRRLGDSIGLHQLDFNALFLAMKDTSKHLLFSRLGTHWTVYGSFLAQDSFIRYIDHARNIKLPALQLYDIQKSDKPQRTDNDLAAGLNLIMHFKKETFSYPGFNYIDTGRVTKLKGIYIGDSFLWTWVNNRLMYGINTDWEVWYYFNEAWNDKSISGLEPVHPMESYNWAKSLNTADIVVTLYNPSNFKGFNYDGSFIEQIYKHYYPGQK